MISWYVAIKLTEWVIWWGIGIYCFIKAYSPKARQPGIQIGLGLAFIFFGFGDFIEYFTAGRLPWWLWTWKIVGGLILFGLLVADDYHKRGAPALSPWRFTAAAFILTMAFICWWFSSQSVAFN
jgi:hypothetical protein